MTSDVFLNRLESEAFLFFLYEVGLFPCHRFMRA
jgi:hypothetical protein